MWASLLHAGTTGKIAGVVKDAKSGEPLPGANIVVVGTTLGAAADAKGEYFIINVPPAQYSVRATMVGYQSVMVTGVNVRVDMTTKVDFQLQEQILELGKEIVVTAERPLIQRDLTSKMAVVESQEVVNMPVDNFQDVLATKAGFTRDASGEIHVRGGRRAELAYLIDGMYVRDPLYGGFGTLINEDAIKEMIVLSGTFNAEYGEAMSGVVNIVTKEGSEAFHGKLEYTSPMLNGSPYRKPNPFPGVRDSYPYVKHSILDDLDFNLAKLEIPLLGQFNTSFSGPVPGLSKMYFFLSGRYENEDLYLPHGYNLERDGQAKLTYKFGPLLKLSATGQKTKVESQGYNHAWKYRREHQAYSERFTDRLALIWDHTIKPNLFYTLLLSRFNQQFNVKVRGKRPEQYERPVTGQTVYFYVQGDDASYIEDRTTTTSARFDMTYQMNARHQFKGGFEVKGHTLKVYEESEPWQGGAQFKERYTRHPVEGAVYLQDKIEYDFLIVNLGLRYDYADPRATMWPDIRRFGYFDENHNWIPAKETEVKPKTQLSPRIGLAHPVTDKTVLHFSYGHFFQNPDYNSLYYNSRKELGALLPLVGNPRVKAQKTVAYEVGLNHQLAKDWAFDVTAWYKDITALLSTLDVRYLSNRYVVFYNSDYASVKGIDLTLRKRYSSYFAASIDYTYSIAKGNNSQPLAGYFDAFEQEEIPHQEYYLDFDQRHDIAVHLDFRIPKGEGPKIGGFRPFANLGINVLTQAASGLPYTPYVDPTLRVDINSGRKPWTWTTDLRVIKGLNVSGLTAAAFVEVTNLFDRQNVVFVYSRTGKPFDTGLPYLVGSSPDADHNPTHVGPPRILKVGVQVLW